MDKLLNKQLDGNYFRFRCSLDRIIDKYSEIAYQNGEIEVPLDDIIFTGMSRNDASQLTVSSLDESQRNLASMELQPKHQDEELEMSLRRSGLVELYPNLIGRLERARRQQYISMATNCVLRRYRRWRQQSNRSNLNTTSVTLKHTNSKPKKMTVKTLPEKRSSNPMKRHFMRTKTTPLQIVTGLQDWQEPHRSPGKEKNLMKKQQSKPILVMDFSASCEPSKPKEMSLNKTVTVSQLYPPKETQLEEQASAYMVSPSQPFAKSSNKRQSLSAKERAGISVFIPEFTASVQRPDIYSSPVRQSPLKARAAASLGRSPYSFAGSPSEYSASSREPTRQRSLTTPLSSLTKKPLKMLYPQKSQQSFVPQLHSPHSATAASGHRRLERHLSFDSSLPPTPVSYSPKQGDEEFMKLYHEFVCQKKSPFFNGLHCPPCRLCLRNSKASRGHSQYAHFREENCTYSPCSKCHRREMLTQGISPSKLEHPCGGGFFYSSIKHRMFQRSSSQQSAALNEDVLEAGSAEDFSDRKMEMEGIIE